MDWDQSQRRDRFVRWSWCSVDSLVWGGAILLACWLRFDFDVTQVLRRGTLWFALAAMAGQALLGGLVGPYAVGHQRGSLEEIADVAKTVFLVGAGLFVWGLLAHPILVPRSVPAMGAALALLAMFALRFAVRASRNRRVAKRQSERRVIVFGAGDAGRRLTRGMLREPDSGFRPVAMLDDDRTKGRLRIDGVPVRGTRASLPVVAKRVEATDLAIALPNADAALIRDIAARADEAGLRTWVLPRLGDILGGRPKPQDLRDIDLEDLLGRRPVELDQDSIAAQLEGKRVLVTGAGGSIGSELCRQIAAFNPAKLLLLDRDESALHATQLSIAGHGLLDGDEVVLVDIRDQGALGEVFDSHRPQVVFHAAALKHLPLLERYPLEAWKTNVLGTLNVAEAALAVGVETFVNVSTDKAANPICTLGYSKRVAERIIADVAGRGSGRFVSVRFGNVLGSRGSVVPAFTAQIQRGGPVTVTHPDARRFFMLIPEACQLVLQAGAIGSAGEAMVLEMGEQVKIVHVAETLIRLSGCSDIEILFTGLRPGEKLAEELFDPHEHRRPTSHPLVSSVRVPRTDLDNVRLARHHSHAAAADWMRECGSHQPIGTPLEVSFHGARG